MPQNETKTVLLTGGTGFAGAHIISHLLENTDWHIIILDRFSYAGTLERIREHIGNPRLSNVYHDFRSPFNAYVLNALEGVDYIIHNGGETHVENSLKDPVPFVDANVMGTLNVLEAAKLLGVEACLFVSTDEVLGPAHKGYDHVETDIFKPSNPYSASKAAAEAFVHAYWKSYKVPVIISRTMNLFGERQHVEKFIPMTIKKIMAGEKVIIHGTKDGQVGSRKWLHARNQADALMFLLLPPVKPMIGEIFHVAGEEKTNLEIAEFIAKVLNKPLDCEIVDFHSQRPGHDLRYSLNDKKIRSIGWQPPISFEESLKKTIEWTIEPANHRWLADSIVRKVKTNGHV